MRCGWVDGIPNSYFLIPNPYLRFAINRKPGVSAGFFGLD